MHERCRGKMRLTTCGTLLDDPLIEVLWVDELRHRAALDLLSRRIDKGYSCATQ